MSSRAPLRAAALLALAALGAIHAASSAQVLLNEVLYDPDGADEGREFVELWNAGDTPVALEGIAVEAGDGARADSWVVIWTGTAADSASPRAAFLIEGPALRGAIQNGPDAVRLTRAGQVLDLLGYGALEPGSMYEGAPAPDAPSGQSLARVTDGVDTNANDRDWAAEVEPTPGAPNHPDLRLRLAASGVTVVPEVEWPGEPVQARAWVRNSGRLIAAGSVWSLEAELGSAATAGGWSPIGTASGVAVAPSESALVSIAFPAPPAGPHAIRLRLRGSDAPGSGSPADRVALADTATAPMRSVAGPAVVSEIAFRDAGAGEWIELRFREPVPDLAELEVADGTAAPRPIDRGAIPRGAAAGQLVVIAQDPERVRARFALPESAVVGLQGGWPSLNDTGPEGGPADRVRVLTAGGTPCDAVPYDAGAVERGGSLERLSIDLRSAAPGSWAESIDPAGGTPGRSNSVQAPGPEHGVRGGALVVAGARVLRRSRGESHPLVLRSTPRARGRRLTVRVHDLLGRPIRTLVEGQRFAAEAAFVWDGRDDAGASAPPGLYVVRAEALSEEGAPGRSSSLGVVVAPERVR